MTTIRRHLRLTFIATAALGFVASAPGALAQTQAEMKAEAKSLAQVCRADFDRLCPSVRPGGGRIVACLKSHATELTPQCRNALPRADALKAKAAAAGVLPR